MPAHLALHSLSHLLIKSIPLIFLASANDVSSLSAKRPDENEENDEEGNGEKKKKEQDDPKRSKGNSHSIVAYLFDAVHEGCGTSEAIFTDFDLCVNQAKELASICDCDDLGCPRCLTIHGCPESNQGLSKKIGMWLLESLQNQNQI